MKPSRNRNRGKLMNMTCPECKVEIYLDDVRVSKAYFLCAKCGQRLCVAESYKRGIRLIGLSLGLASAIIFGKTNPLFFVLLWVFATFIAGSLLVTFGRYYVTPPIERYLPPGTSLGLRD